MKPPAPEMPGAAAPKGELQQASAEPVRRDGLFLQKALRKARRRHSRRERAARKLYAGARIWFREQGTLTEARFFLERAHEATQAELSRGREAGEASR